MLSLGFNEWDTVVGIRADGLTAWRKLNPACDNSAGFPLLPHDTAGVRKADVLAFWRAQPFDLQPDPLGDLDNCDMCFLKARHKIVNALVDEPQHALWRIAQESRAPRYRFCLRQFFRLWRRLQHIDEVMLPRHCWKATAVSLQFFSSGSTAGR